MTVVETSRITRYRSVRTVWSGHAVMHPLATLTTTECAFVFLEYLSNEVLDSVSYLLEPTGSHLPCEAVESVKVRCNRTHNRFKRFAWIGNVTPYIAYNIF